MLVVITSACVVHQQVGDDAVTPVSLRKLINQARRGVGGRKRQRRISLSYFTTLAISAFIDDDYRHSMKDYCFCNMKEKGDHSYRLWANNKQTWIDALRLEGKIFFFCMQFYFDTCMQYYNVLAPVCVEKLSFRFYIFFYLNS